jgi:Protein of unknown function (DUF2892)
MQCNVGKTERVIRVIAGVVIIGAGFLYQSWWGVIGLVPLLTGATGYCPPYQLLGISTNKK